MFIYQIFFIHSSVDRPLACFCILAIVNNTVMIIGVYVLFVEFKLQNNKHSKRETKS